MLGMANGCFDGLHEGHRFFLLQCAMLCDELIIALNTDPAVRALKGEGRPINDVWARRDALLATGKVSDVKYFGKNLRGIIRQTKPDIVFRGWDQMHEPWLAGYRVVSIPQLPGYSTTLEVARRCSGG